MCNEQASGILWGNQTPLIQIQFVGAVDGINLIDLGRHGIEEITRLKTEGLHPGAREVLIDNGELRRIYIDV